MKCAVHAESLMVDELYEWNRNLMDMVVWTMVASLPGWTAAVSGLVAV